MTSSATHGVPIKGRGSITVEANTMQTKDTKREMFWDSISPYQSLNNLQTPYQYHPKIR